MSEARALYPSSAHPVTTVPKAPQSHLPVRVAVMGVRGVLRQRRAQARASADPFARRVRRRRCRVAGGRTPTRQTSPAPTSARRRTRATSHRQAAPSRRPAAPAPFSSSRGRLRATSARPARTRPARASRHALPVTRARTAPRAPARRCRARRARTPTPPTSQLMRNARRPPRATLRQPAAPGKRHAVPVPSSPSQVKVRATGAQPVRTRPTRARKGVLPVSPVQ